MFPYQYLITLKGLENIFPLSSCTFFYMQMKFCFLFFLVFLPVLFERKRNPELQHTTSHTILSLSEGVTFKHRLKHHKANEGDEETFAIRALGNPPKCSASYVKFVRKHQRVCVPFQLQFDSLGKGGHFFSSHSCLMKAS